MTEHLATAVFGPEEITASPTGVPAGTGHLGRRVLRRRRAAARKQRPGVLDGPGTTERSPAAFEKEERRRIKRAVKQAKKLLRRIRQAWEAGDVHRALGLERVFLASWDAKLAAAWEALRKAKGLGRDPIIAAAIAGHMMNSRRTVDEKIRVFTKRKRSGGTRLICKYGPEDKARQVQARMALGAVVDLRPEQYGVTGRGLDAAIRDLTRFVEELDGEGYTYRSFMALDIRDNYPSIEASRLEEFLTGKLPRETIRNVITNLERKDDIRTIHKGDPSDDDGSQRAPQQGARALSGLPQGSACSSLVAAMVVKWALERLVVPERARLLNYADNIIVLGATREDVEATYLSLRSLLRTSPVGRLELKREAIGSVDEGLEWLGYRVERRPDRVEVRPTDKKIVEFKVEVAARLVEIAAEGEQTPRSAGLRDGLIGYVRSWTASHRVEDDDGRPIADARLMVLEFCADLMDLAPRHPQVGFALRLAARSLFPRRAST